MGMRKINEIIVHCTATRPDWWAGKSAAAKVKEITRWHLDRGWSDIGYHYLIDRDGTVVTGRPLDRTGAHVKGHNTGTVGISLFGGFGGSAGDSFADNFTEDQERALLDLIAKLKADHPSITKISGHNQYAAKACPCFSVPAWLKKAQSPKMKPPVDTEKPRALAQSKTMQASVVQGASAVGGAVAAFQALDGTAQIIAITGCILITLLAMYIMKERLKAWAAGWR
jgi:N-acetylmuramoyl-L-alanine amidase